MKIRKGNDIFINITIVDKDNVQESFTNTISSIVKITSSTSNCCHTNTPTKTATNLCSSLKSPQVCYEAEHIIIGNVITAYFPASALCSSGIYSLILTYADKLVEQEQSKLVTDSITKTIDFKDVFLLVDTTEQAETENTTINITNKKI